QLDAHEDDDHVAPDQDTHHPDDEEHRAQEQKMICAHVRHCGAIAPLLLPATNGRVIPGIADHDLLAARWQARGQLGCRIGNRALSTHTLRQHEIGGARVAERDRAPAAYSLTESLRHRQHDRADHADGQNQRCNLVWQEEFGGHAPGSRYDAISNGRRYSVYSDRPSACVLPPTSAMFSGVALLDTPLTVRPRIATATSTRRTNPSRAATVR